ncbi:hypothetical protein Hamer_G008562 [Homarus americanus]|uniref:Uncharacterized protein n=1 Tax=Homarus americanus TaxID=6706 RepID=A0A8J5T6Y6_HOMAM|nr:hypothetical protein Hamer_G008562 [Homarus americanus]
MDSCGAVLLGNKRPRLHLGCILDTPGRSYGVYFFIVHNIKDIINANSIMKAMFTRDASVTWLKDELLQVEDERVLARGWWLVGDMQRTLCPKAVGCFTLDNHCFVAVGSFVATYVVILLQFTTNNTTSAFTTSHPPTTASIIRVFFSSLLRLVFICLITCFMRTLAKTLTETRRAIATHLESNDRLAYVTCPISPVDDPGTRDLSKSHHDARHLNTMGATHLRTSARGQDWSLHDLVPTSVINEAQLKTFESLLRQVETLQDRVFDYFGPPLICHFLNIVLSSIADTYFLFNFEPVFTRSCLALLANILSLVVILHGTWIMQKEGWWLVGDMQRTLCPKAVGCFTLDNHCFVAVGSFVATYVVILLQFTTNNTTSAFTTSHPPTTASSGL